MQTEAERIFYRRIYILIALTAAILCGLFYLMLLTRGHVPSMKPSVQPSFTAVNKLTRSIEVEKTEILVTAEAKPEPVPVEPKPEPVPADPEPVPQNPDNTNVQPETVTADVTTNTSVTRIVSPSHRIEADFVPSGLVVPDVPMYRTQQLRSDAASSLEDMFAAAKDDGLDLYLISGYRSYEYQQGLWDYYYDYFGPEYTERMDARPGGTEHQLGLSVDIGTTDDVCRLDFCFGDTAAFAWLQENSYKYGFIERYPYDKESVTGIMYSPWSFRYIGTEEAVKLYEAQQTMEEFYSID